MLRVILNVLWLLLGGLVLALGWLLAAVVMFILIITIPFGLQALKIAGFTLWPFGRTLLKRPDAGAASAIGNVIWFILAGWWLAIGHLVAAVALAITIVGIPRPRGRPDRRGRGRRGRRRAALVVAALLRTAASPVAAPLSAPFRRR